MNIRSARTADAPFLANALIIAGRAHVSKGIWEVVLGGTEEECLRFLQHVTISQTPHLFHYSYSLIAENEKGEPMGSLGGYNPKKAGYQALQEALFEVNSKLDISAHQAKASGKRAEKLMACFPAEIEGAWVIDSVATLPGHRGKGVAEELIRQIVEIGKGQGYLKAAVNMYIGNEPALNLYQKLGFKIQETKKTPYFEQQIGSPGMLSLVKAL